MTCYRMRGAYQHKEVRVGWYPHVTTQATEVRSKPGAGTVLADLVKGAGFCRQSVRNPSLSSTPALRRPVQGADGELYVWGYARKGGFTGWVRLDHLIPDAGAARKPEARGPAGVDFEGGRGVPRTTGGPGCGLPVPTRPKLVVKSRETHLRYSPHGTGFHYLHRGDVVKILLKNAPQGQHFVEVVEASRDGSAKPGARGWVSVAALPWKGRQ